MDKKVNEVIEEVFEKFGKDILLEGDRFCAILFDMMPKMQLENRVLRRMSQEKILLEIHNIIANKDNYTSKSISKVERLLHEAGFSEEWKEIAMDIFGFVTKKKSEENNSDNVQCTLHKNGKKKCLGKNQARNLFPNIPDEIIIPNGYSIIGKNAFNYYLGYRGKTKKIIISETVEEIQDSAFDNLEVSDYIEIPKSVTKIGDYFPFKLGEFAYIKCELESYAYEYCRKHHIKNSVDNMPWIPTYYEISLKEAVEKNVKVEEINGKKWNVLFISDAVSIGKGAFRNRTDIEVLVIGKGTKYIKKNAFKGCVNLKYVFFSDTLISIAANAFANCTSLTYIQRECVSTILKEIYTLEGKKEEELFVEKTAFEGCLQVRIIEDSENILGKFFEGMDVNILDKGGNTELIHNTNIESDIYLEYISISIYIHRTVYEIMCKDRKIFVV